MSISPNNNSKKIFIIPFILMVILLVFTFTLSKKYDNPARNILADIILLDEDAYGQNNFDSTNLDFKPILDKNIEKNLNNVIYITFNVGGSKKNNTPNIVYDIALNDLEIDCNLLSPYLKWKLIKNNVEISEGSLDYKFDTIKNGRLVLTNIQQDLVPYSTDKNTYDHYKFYMWLSDSCQSDNLLDCMNSEDQTNLLGKSLSGKIEVELYGDTKQELIRKPTNQLDNNTCLSE